MLVVVDEEEVVVEVDDEVVLEVDDVVVVVVVVDVLVVIVVVDMLVVVVDVVVVGDVVVVVDVLVVVVGTHSPMPSHRPPTQAVPLVRKWQALSQHESCVPFARPSSHCSPASTVPLPHVVTNVLKICSSKTPRRGSSEMSQSSANSVFTSSWPLR